MSTTSSHLAKNHIIKESGTIYCNNTELLSLFIAPKKAAVLMKDYHQDLRSIVHAGRDILCHDYHLTDLEFARIHGLTTIHKRLTMFNGDRVTYDQPSLLVDRFQWLAAEPTEQFCTIFLNHRNRIKTWVTTAIGGTNAAPVLCEPVFVAAVKHSAASVIFVHNHPGGCVTPSGEDIKITNVLEKGLKTLDIRCLDHIIVGLNEDYFSFREHSLLS